MQFIPHVLPVVAGTTVKFLNSDPTPHNVFSPDNEKYNLGTWPQGQSKDYVFSKCTKFPCVYTQLCRVHPEMEGFVVVAAEPVLRGVGPGREVRDQGRAAGQLHGGSLAPEAEGPAQAGRRRGRQTGGRGLHPREVGPWRHGGIHRRPHAEVLPRPGAVSYRLSRAHQRRRVRPGRGRRGHRPRVCDCAGSQPARVHLRADLRAPMRDRLPPREDQSTDFDSRAEAHADRAPRRRAQNRRHHGAARTPAPGGGDRRRAGARGGGRCGPRRVELRPRPGRPRLPGVDLRRSASGRRHAVSGHSRVPAVARPDPRRDRPDPRAWASS